MLHGPVYIALRSGPRAGEVRYAIVTGNIGANVELLVATGPGDGLSTSGWHRCTRRAVACAKEAKDAVAAMKLESKQIAEEAEEARKSAEAARQKAEKALDELEDKKAQADRKAADLMASAKAEEQRAKQLSDQSKAARKSLSLVEK